jgi:hypothetical protein
VAVTGAISGGRGDGQSRRKVASWAAATAAHLSGSTLSPPRACLLPGTKVTWPQGGRVCRTSQLLSAALPYTSRRLIAGCTAGVHTGYGDAVFTFDRRRDGTASLVGPIAAAVLLGLITGVATSLLQGVLPVPWVALVNAASPWLAVAFIAGALVPVRGLAAVAGAATCAAEVVGYYVTAAARDFPAANTTIAFWILCGLLGGSLFAEIGRMWRSGSPRVSLMASGALGACFLLEAVRYATVLHYGSRAALFTVVAVAIPLLGLLVRASRDQLAEAVPT